MKKIPLTKGQFALVDDEDFEEINKNKWCAYWSPGNETFYAHRHRGSMHRAIMNPPEKMSVDHINGNGLDNRKVNLRICTHAQNMKNVKKSSLNTSGYKGVSWDSEKKRWRAEITVDRKRIRLGRYKIKEDAARAYNAASKKYHGEFGRLNEIDA